MMGLVTHRNDVSSDVLIAVARWNVQKSETPRVEQRDALRWTNNAKEIYTVLLKRAEDRKVALKKRRNTT